MPRSFLIKKSSTKLINSSFSSNTNTSFQPNGCTDDEENIVSQHNDNNKSFVDLSYDGKGPFDLSIKSHLLKETNIDIKNEINKSEKTKEISVYSNSYTNAQYRDASLFNLQSVNSAKCLSRENYSPNGEMNGDLIKPALIPLEPINTSQRLSPSSPHNISRHFQAAPFVPFSFNGCANFGYNENKNLVTSPSLYYQARHLDYPISPPQTPILRSERLSANNYNSSLENSHHPRHTVISPVSEYRPQYWNEQIPHKTTTGSLVISSPTPSLNGSDDSGRGSVHSRGSVVSMENASKYQESMKVDNRTVKSRKPTNGSDGNATRYHCTDCNKSYSTYSGLSKHQEFHCATQAKKAFSCKHCDKVYVSLGALKMHIRTHTLPCKCKLCGKAFSRPWLLQGHIRTHTGEKPFACQYCSRAFADRSNLRAHLQTHSDVKKYSCKTCSKTFSRMSLLLKHEDGGCAHHRLQ